MLEADFSQAFLCWKPLLIDFPKLEVVFSYAFPKLLDDFPMLFSHVAYASLALSSSSVQMSLRIC